MAFIAPETGSVGEQLDLFALRPRAVATPVAEAPATMAGDPVAQATLVADEGQMDLFGDRWLRAAAAHKALETFDLEAASVALQETVRLYPSDTSLADRAHRVSELSASLSRAMRMTPSRAAALVAIEHEVPPYLARAWHLSLAAEIDGGDVVEGRPAGFHWLCGGAVERAEQSLVATRSKDPENSRARGYLGDALFVQGHRAQSRTAYRDALAASHSQIDLERIQDLEVRDLSGLAEVDFELPGESFDWMAAVGLIEGMFARPESVPAHWFDASELEAIAPGIRFYRWLVREMASRDDAERIECRRAMKASSPRLFKEVLAKRR